jgi:hypothetical protein
MNKPILKYYSNGDFISINGFGILPSKITNNTEIIQGIISKDYACTFTQGDSKEHIKETLLKARRQ